MTIDPAVPLTADGLDRAAERRTDPAWLAERWADATSRVLHVHEGRVETEPGTGRLVLVPPYATEVPRLLLGVDPEGVAHFAVLGTRPGAEDAGGEAWAGLRELGGVLPGREAALVVHALGLANWHERHPRCPRCGGETVIESGGYVRRCATDGSLHHPRTDPAVIMLVTDEQDRALLGRHARWPGQMFSTLAGFVEPGESAEAAVAREVYEESGVRVDEVTFVASQPWPFPASLMLGFRARARGTEPVADGVEMAEVRWFTRDELATEHAAGDLLLPSGLSIARRLVEDWYGGTLTNP
jgi:NAD+ diphosphatase